MIVMNHDGDLFEERRKKDRRKTERRKNEDNSPRDRRKSDRRVVNISASKKNK